MKTTSSWRGIWLDEIVNKKTRQCGQDLSIRAMAFMTFDMNGTDWTGGTQMFTGAATNAAFSINHGDLRRFGIFGVERSHMNGAHRAVGRTIVAIHAIAQNHATRFCPNRVANLQGGLFLSSYRLDGACWANRGAGNAFRPTITALKGELRPET